MRWMWFALGVAACGGPVATFDSELDREDEAPKTVRFHDDGPVVVVPTTPAAEPADVVDAVAQASAPAPTAWPPIAPPVDGRVRDEPFDWPFEARPSGGRVEAEEGADASDVHLVDPGLLR